METLFDEKMTQSILKTLKSGKSVELKLEKGNLVVVELQRKVKEKASING